MEKGTIYEMLDNVRKMVIFRTVSVVIRLLDAHVI